MNHPELDVSSASFFSFFVEIAQILQIFIKLKILAVSKSCKDEVIFQKSA